MLNNFNDDFEIKVGSVIVSLTRNPADVAAAQRLRYQIFAEEMGAKIISDVGLDVDRFDEFCHHLIARDATSGEVIGTYRVITQESATAAGTWYTATEFDVTNLLPILPKTAELGRACVHADHRNGSVIAALWSGLIKFMLQKELQYMIGCGSVEMHDGGDAAASLFRQLQKKHYSPEQYRVYPLNPLPLESFKQDLQVSCPPLIRGYMRVGAYICGEPAWDPDFNTADMVIVMPIANINPRYIKHFVK